MSYDIVYERQFVKTSTGEIIPLVLYGSNNFCEIIFDRMGRQRERRVRQWTPYSNQDIPVLTADEIMSETKNLTGGPYQEHFKRYGKWIDDDGLIRFMQKGIQEAKTIEELNELSCYPIRLHGYLSIWKEDTNTSELSTHISSSEELTAFIDAARERKEQKIDGESFNFILRFPDEKAIPYPKNTD